MLLIQEVCNEKGNKKKEEIELAMFTLVMDVFMTSNRKIGIDISNI